ncbi:MAG: putative repeat domain protein [Acidobacteria bacterium]|nr:putative repeat domain protein [Acidobacteriota bacterium]
MRQLLRNLIMSGVSFFFICFLLAPLAVFANDSVQQERPLTFKQIEELIRVPTPDRAIALEIDKLAVNFEVDDETIRQMQALGAGPLTLAAIQKQRNKGGRLRTTILVADFRGVNNENVGLYEILLQQLRDSVAAYPDVEIQPLGKSITAEQGREVALREGREHHAAIVLWGWFVKSSVEGRVNAYIEFLRPPHIVRLTSGREEYRVGLNEFNEFTIQSKLSKALTSISLAATALARLDAADYQGAISRLTEALSMGASEPQLIGASDMYTYRALAYFLEANAKRADTIYKFFDTIGKAIADCDQAIKLNNKNISAYLLRAYSMLVKGAPDEALSEGKKLLAIFEDPIDRISVYLLLIRALDQQGDNQAIANHQQAAAYDEELLKLTEKPAVPTSNTYEARALAHDRLMNEREALESLRKALDLKPDDILRANLHFFTGSILQRRGEYTEALKEFGEVIQIDPRRTDAYTQIGHILYWKKEYPRSIANYSAALKLAPRDSMQYSNRGRVYQDSGDLASALKDYDKSIELEPTNDAALYNRASLHNVQGRVDEALADLKRCIESSPNHHDAIYLRGDLYLSKNDYDASIVDYTRIIELDSHDAEAFFRRGSAHNRKSSIEKALDDYDQAIILSPNYSAAYLRRGIIKAGRGNRKDAIVDLSHAVEYSDDIEIRKEAQQELTKLRAKP